MRPPTAAKSRSGLGGAEPCRVGGLQQIRDHPMFLVKKSFAAATLALFCATLAFAQVTLPTARLRGTVKSFDGSTLVMTERSGETLSLGVAETFAVNEVV